MLVEVWQHLEGRMRVAILNGAAWQAPMMARDRHAPIVDAIERADVTAALHVVDEHMASAAERFTQAPESA
jgi:DNA-binding GntR family transcriptional regulator